MGIETPKILPDDEVAVGELEKSELSGPEELSKDSKIEKGVNASETTKARLIESVATSEKRQMEEVTAALAKTSKPKSKPKADMPLGDFAGAEINEKRIVVDKQTKEHLENIIPSVKKDADAEPKSRFRSFLGSKTATEYDGKANTMSTVTKIINLPDGRRVFAVYNYPTSGIHRSIDTFVRKVYGNPLQKARNEDWKKVFESRSGIPTIESGDPNVVLMPYIPNVNAYDLFTLNHKIKDFGPHEWAGKVGAEEKIVIAKRIIKALKEKHVAGISWGEIILNNIIIQPDGTPVIVDPETQYNADVPFDEQKARDLQEIIISICAGLNGGEGIDNFQSTVKELLDEYKDPSITEKLKNLINKKPTISQRIIQPLYNTLWRRINKDNFNGVREAISQY